MVIFSLTHLVTVLHRRNYRFLHLVKNRSRADAGGVHEQRHVAVVPSLQRKERLGQKRDRVTHTNGAVDPRSGAQNAS